MLEVSAINPSQIAHVPRRSIVAGKGLPDDNLFVCECDCHTDGLQVAHPVPCCEEAPCGTMVKVGFMIIHQNNCSICKEIAE